MLLYSATCSDFYKDVASQNIADKISSEFKVQLGYTPNKSEYRSWQNSLTALHFSAKLAGLSDQGVIVEYKLPNAGLRLDVMFTGADAAGKDSAAVIELKQWDECDPAEGDHVLTWLNGGKREALHPSVQVGRYLTYLEDGQSVFHEGDPPVSATASAYLHNYRYISQDPLLDDKFVEAIKRCPIFTKDDQQKLVTELAQRVGGGAGDSVLERVLESEARPSKKLLEHVGQMLEGKAEYVLLDDQLIAYDRVITEARKALKRGATSTVLIEGGPGTGKSVVALNLLAQLSKDGYNSHYLTGSQAFTESLKKIAGTRAAQQFRSFGGYPVAEPRAVDVLICDEAHRIRKTSVHRFTKPHERSGKQQIDELLDAAKVNVFFVDDLQRIRGNEVGSMDLIRKSSKSAGKPVYEYKLAAQFRCAGSDGFINWVTHTLGLDSTGNDMWTGDQDFEFEIVGSPHDLAAMIRDKAESGATARMAAGYCWHWAKLPRSDGTLEDDVVIGDFKMPWNARSGSGPLAPGIPKEVDWARDPGGLEQIGCIYTAQGFEFDYAGVIFGPDLVYREGAGWISQRGESHDRVAKQDPDSFTERIKNVYRVLLTRGMKGCYVHFTDDETRAYWESRIASP
jgi:DUF2075 family protein